MTGHRIAIWVMALAFAGAGAASAIAAAPEVQLLGIWHGALPGKKEGEVVRLVLTVTRERGTLVARMRSPDQDNVDRISQTVRVTGRRVEFYLVYMSSSYDGTMSDDGSEMRGIWTQHRVATPLVFRRAVAD